MKPLAERYQADPPGVLSCYDRMIITGALPGACYAGGMTSLLNSRHIRIFDYAKLFADPWRERLRQCAHEIAASQGVSIEHVNKPHIRKEELSNVSLEFPMVAVNIFLGFLSSPQPTAMHL